MCYRGSKKRVTVSLQFFVCLPTRSHIPTSSRSSGFTAAPLDSQSRLGVHVAVHGLVATMYIAIIDRHDSRADSVDLEKKQRFVW